MAEKGIYREEGLAVRKRRARRKAIGTRAPILVEAKIMRDGRWILCMIPLPGRVLRSNAREGVCFGATVPDFEHHG